MHPCWIEVLISFYKIITQTLVYILLWIWPMYLVDTHRLPARQQYTMDKEADRKLSLFLKHKTIRAWFNNVSHEAASVCTYLTLIYKFTENRTRVIYVSAPHDFLLFLLLSSSEKDKVRHNSTCTCSRRAELHLSCALFFTAVWFQCID